MYLYALFILLAICAFTDVMIPEKKRTFRYEWAFFSIIFILFFLSAFRFERGTDWFTYEDYFAYLQGGADGWLEPGFTLLNRLVHSVSSNYSCMVFAVSAIVFVLKPKALYTLATYPFVALLTWYAISLADIFPVRQTIASALLLYSVIFIVRKQFVPFLILIVLATTFHASSFIFFIAYYLFHLRISRRLSVLAFAGSFIVAFGAQGLMEKVLTSLSNPIVQEKIGSYLSAGTDETYGSIRSAKDILIRGFVNRGMILILVFTLLNNLRKHDPVLNGWGNLFVFGSIVFAFMTSVNVALGRLSVYFDLAQLFIFAYLFKLRMSTGDRVIVYSLLALYLFYRFYGVVNNYYELYIPYKSVF